MHVKKNDAVRMLNDVFPEHKRFWINKGNIASNLEDLYKNMKKMKKDTFVHHVHDGRNDFSRWILDVVGDKKLAKDLNKIRTKTSTLKKIEARLKFLKKKAS